MPDFRNALYQSYVTKFKTEQTQIQGRAIESIWSWYEYKYLPLLADLDKNSAILELGCGPGYILEFLKQCGFTKAAGIDISEEQIAIATKRNLNVQTTDAFKYLATKKEVFDAIIAIDFLEHFSKEELFQLIPLIHQALKRDGRLIIQTPNGQGIFPHQVIYGDLTHLTIFTPDSLQQLLNLFGFDQIKFYETGPIPKTIKGKIRFRLWQLIKHFANLIRSIETGKRQMIWTENMICLCYKK
uniref:Class I SAM-dependent methyltransferase n=1 Tax=candidate division WOR-3 bacterium TaxID=2052148 RepID=A0A7C6ECB1_UNCW3